MQGTYSAKPAEVTRSWFVVDATDKPLGRLASDIARILRGKHKPIFTTHVDTGDFVVVLNASKVALTGAKATDKHYYRYSGHMGGLRKRAAGDLLAVKPAYVLERAVWGMLPKNSLGRQMLTKMKVYAGAEHPHQAQQPAALPTEF